MTRFALLLALLPSLALAENHLMADHKTVAYDCSKDPATNIMGNHNTITLTGACDAVNISGNDNKLTGASAKTINVSGNGNTLNVTTATTVNLTGNRNALSWKKANATDAGPKVNNSGNDNKVAGS